MTTSIVTAPMKAKAAKLVDLMPTFSRGTSKITGERFIVVPASNRLTAHWTAVDGSGCTCLGHQRRGTCTHSIAAKIVHDRQTQPAAAPAPKRSRYEALFPKCKSCDDLADTRDGYCDRCASDREWQARRELATAS
jgi:hypothetical protein